MFCFTNWPVARSVSDKNVLGCLAFFCKPKLHTVVYFTLILPVWRAKIYLIANLEWKNYRNQVVGELQGVLFLSLHSPWEAAFAACLNSPHIFHMTTILESCWKRISFRQYHSLLKNPRLEDQKSPLLWQLLTLPKSNNQWRYNKFVHGGGGGGTVRPFIGQNLGENLKTKQKVSTKLWCFVSIG